MMREGNQMTANEMEREQGINPSVPRRYRGQIERPSGAEEMTMTYTTINDLRADIINRLGLQNEDREAITEAIRDARKSPYEEIDADELDQIMRAVWADVVGDDDYPFESA